MSTTEFEWLKLQLKTSRWSGDGAVAPQWHDSPERELSNAFDDVERDLYWALRFSPNTDMMRRYLRWDEHRQVEFRRTLAVLREQAERQYQIYLCCIMAPFECEHVAQALGWIDASPIRMAKRRAQTFMQEYAGGSIEVDIPRATPENPEHH